MTRRIGIGGLLAALLALGMFTTSAWAGTMAPQNWSKPCGQCHKSESSLWSSSADLHALSNTVVLTNSAHNTAELLTNDCLLCHSAFDWHYGIAHFVTPVNQIGNPPGVWTALNTGDWQATRCLVCHSPNSTAPYSLDFYNGATATYTGLAQTASETISDLSTGNLTSFSFTSIQSATEDNLCYSCHNPTDQGTSPAPAGFPSTWLQGGDSRAFVTASHKDMPCITCHSTHDFTPSNANATYKGKPSPPASCSGSSCHSVNRVPATPTVSSPGVVHIDHLFGL